MQAVYKITNKVNNRVYIGSSVNVITRINGHKSSLKINKHPNLLLQEDYNLFGESNFVYSIIEFITDEEKASLRNKEKTALDEYSEIGEVYNLYFDCGSIYPHIREFKISHKTIATAFGFKTIKSFRCSSAHKRYMHGIESILEFIKTNKNNQHGPIDKA